MPDSQWSEPGFESLFVTVSKIGHFRSLHWRPSWLSCINEYLAIDSGGNGSDLALARNCCLARMLPGEAELVLEWTGLPGEAKSVKRFERSNRLDTALYKNYLCLLSPAGRCGMPIPTSQESGNPKHPVTSADRPAVAADVSASLLPMERVSCTLGNEPVLFIVAWIWLIPPDQFPRTKAAGLIVTIVACHSRMVTVSCVCTLYGNTWKHAIRLFITIGIAF